MSQPRPPTNRFQAPPTHQHSSGHAHPTEARGHAHPLTVHSFPAERHAHSTEATPTHGSLVLPRSALPTLGAGCMRVLLTLGSKLRPKPGIHPAPSCPVTLDPAGATSRGCGSGSAPPLSLGCGASGGHAPLGLLCPEKTLPSLSVGRGSHSRALHWGGGVGRLAISALDWSRSRVPSIAPLLLLEVRSPRPLGSRPRGLTAPQRAPSPPTFPLT